MAGLRLRGVQPRVLEPVDLELATGEIVFVSGPSGSGKSLLLRAVADLDPRPGEVWLDGVARSSMPAPEWRRRVGLLPAEAHWWAEHVGNHFPFLSGGTEQPSWLELLEILGFESDVLEWAVSRLSTGERQRLAFARLVANQPEALLLDEATANLDPANRERVEALVSAYRAEHAAPVLWVSHDPEQRRRLDGRSLVIHERRLEPEA
ncbi:MAG: ABC transporter ATP-binding protein [Chromatiaceae bacterium]